MAALQTRVGYTHGFVLEMRAPFLPFHFYAGLPLLTPEGQR